MIVRKVRPSGSFRWRGAEIFIGEALIVEPVAFEQLDKDSYQVYVGPLKVARSRAPGKPESTSASAPPPCALLPPSPAMLDSHALIAYSLWRNLADTVY